MKFSASAGLLKLSSFKKNMAMKLFKLIKSTFLFAIFLLISLLLFNHKLWNASVANFLIQPLQAFANAVKLRFWKTHKENLAFGQKSNCQTQQVGGIVSKPLIWIRMAIKIYYSALLCWIWLIRAVLKRKIKVCLFCFLKIKRKRPPQYFNKKFTKIKVTNDYSFTSICIMNHFL